MAECLRSRMIRIEGCQGYIDDPDVKTLTPRLQVMVVAGNSIGELIDGAAHDAGELRSYRLSCKVAECAVACSLSATEDGVIVVTPSTSGPELEQCVQLNTS